jgi:exosortase A
MSAPPPSGGARRTAPWNGLLRTAPALVGGAILLLAIFWQEGSAALQVWSVSTAYSHCYFVLPIALYILWDRRDRLRDQSPQPLPWLALGAAPLGLAWLLAERVGFMEGRQLVAMTILELLFLAVLGWRLWWRMSAGLLYLYFLVPFGAFLTPWLQHFTAHFIQVGLNLLAIPNYVDSYLIEIPEGLFYVAEACAGLRFLIAAVAFGVLYSVLIYRSPWRRAGFMLASIVIPIIANGFRALGIVVLGHILGSAEAGAADHVIYGWLFFSFVILLLILAGMPFREDLPPAGATAAPARRTTPRGPFPARPVYLAAGLACLLALLAPMASLGLSLRDGPVHPGAPPNFVAMAPCAATPAVSSAAASLAPGAGSVTSFSCGAMTLRVTVLAFPPHSTRAPIRAALRTLQPEGDELETGTLVVPNGAPRDWQLVQTGNTLRAVASTIWVNGAPAQGGLAGRLGEVRNSLVGARFAPVLVVVDAELPATRATGFARQPARNLLLQFLRGQYDLAAQIRRFAAESAGGS